MFKRKIILVALISSSFFGIFGCINCGEHLAFQEIKNIKASLFSYDFEPIGTKTDLDSLAISVKFDVGFIANHFSFPLINRSYAWSCDENGELGLKDKIVDLKFFSSVDYLGIPAGTGIDLKNSNKLPKAELIEKLNNFLNDFVLFLEKKQTGYFDLHVAFELESGAFQDFELTTFEWE